MHPGFRITVIKMLQIVFSLSELEIKNQLVFHSHAHYSRVGLEPKVYQLLAVQCMFPVCVRDQKPSAVKDHGYSVNAEATETGLYALL